MPARTPQPAVTTITISAEPLHTNVKRFGINLSGQSFYDTAQMLRNLAFRNPGFEGGTWQSILRCKTVTATTCTDQNEYAVWPANFLEGADYEIMTGASRGVSGIVQSSTIASQGHGVTITLDIRPQPVITCSSASQNPAAPMLAGGPLSTAARRSPPNSATSRPTRPANKPSASKPPNRISPP